MKKQGPLILVLSLCAGIISVTCLQALFVIKSQEAFFTYKELRGGSFEQFMSKNIKVFLYLLIIPMGLAFYTYFTWKRLGTPKLYRIVWAGLVCLSFFNTLFTFYIFSVFYYFSLGLHIILFFVILNIHHLKKDV